MNDWISYVQEHESSYVTHYQCTQKNTNSITDHKHPTSGNDYSVRHMPLTLHHLPEDSSGKDAKNMQKDVVYMKVQVLVQARKSFNILFSDTPLSI